MEERREREMIDRDEYGTVEDAGRKGGAVAAGTAPAHPRALPEVWPYALNWKSAFAAGFLATAALTLILYFLPPLFGYPPMNVAQQLGSFIALETRNIFWAGMLWHLANGIFFTVVYAWVLLKARTQSDAKTGAVFGAVVWLLAMILMPVMMAFHPQVRAGVMANPGFFLRGLDPGLGLAMLDLFAHLVFGILAGVIYKHREACE